MSSIVALQTPPQSPARVEDEEPSLDTQLVILEDLQTPPSTPRHECVDAVEFGSSEKTVTETNATDEQGKQSPTRAEKEEETSSEATSLSGAMVAQVKIISSENSAKAMKAVDEQERLSPARTEGEETFSEATLLSEAKAPQSPPVTPEDKSSTSQGEDVAPTGESVGTVGEPRVVKAVLDFPELSKGEIRHTPSTEATGATASNERLVQNEILKPIDIPSTAEAVNIGGLAPLEVGDDTEGGDDDTEDDSVALLALRTHNILIGQQYVPGYQPEPLREDGQPRCLGYAKTQGRQCLSPESSCKWHRGRRMTLGDDFRTQHPNMHHLPGRNANILLEPGIPTTPASHNYDQLIPLRYYPLNPVKATVQVSIDQFVQKCHGKYAFVIARSIQNLLAGPSLTSFFFFRLCINN